VKECLAADWSDFSVTEESGQRNFSQNFGQSFSVVVGGAKQSFAAAGA
jgi:hypothetical protein